MKAGIHPEYIPSKITCACGRATETYATVEELHVEICSHCHPFYTGRQKLVDTAGRVERFRRKYGSDEAPASDDSQDDSEPSASGETVGSDAPDEAEAEAEPVGAADAADGGTDED